MNPRILAAFFCPLLACSTPGYEQPPPAGAAGDPAASAAATITAAEMREHIAFLASDELLGRQTPSPGLERAASYLAEEFSRAGLEPAGDGGSYFQRYRFPLRALVGRGVRLEFPGHSLPPPRYGIDYFARANLDTTVAGELVFTGGAVAPEHRERVRGRVAVVALPAAGRAWRRTAARSIRAAAEGGAAAVLFVLDPTFGADSIEARTRLEEQPEHALVGVPTAPGFFLSHEYARRLLTGTAASVVGTSSGPHEVLAAPVVLPGLALSGTVAVAELMDAEGTNVVALLRGAGDPASSESYVALTAHFDHEGVGLPDATGDSIYNGADDNASGTAALLEIAEAFAALPARPSRSILFVAVSGEEKGLLGSRYFTSVPTVPLERAVANVNLDMISRNSPDTIAVIGSEFSSLGAMLDRVIAERPEIGLAVVPDPWPELALFGRSDHFNFVRRGIPALFFFAGEHADYHRPSDEVELVDPGKAARVARLAFHVLYRVAQDPEEPRWSEEGRKEVRRLTR